MSWASPAPAPFLSVSSDFVTSVPSDFGVGLESSGVGVGAGVTRLPRPRPRPEQFANLLMFHK